jgi:hypothetical protein
MRVEHPSSMRVAETTTSMSQLRVTLNGGVKTTLEIVGEMMTKATHGSSMLLERSSIHLQVDTPFSITLEELVNLIHKCIWYI